MTQPKPKRALRGAALQGHLRKEFKSLEDFHAETLRLEAEVRLARRERNPLYRSAQCLGWGVFVASLIGSIALFIQPGQIKAALMLGFALGTSGSALERRE
ncbi:hypothetical protein NDA03_26025 [Trichocoleus sp. Lan]|uniref:hypothetical protein n=1 Tax=Trichocoleus sp. Lan TaxID=2933927 RepID=UPI003297678E